MCCEPYLTNTQDAPSPEALMRSRYTAYTMSNMDYIQKTMCGKAANGFNLDDARRRAAQVVWVGLQVLNAFIETPKKGYVEFVAAFVAGSQLRQMHEVSEFAQIGGQWFYVDGNQMEPVDGLSIKTIARNTACPCGSQRKYKNCHGNVNT